VACVLQRDLKQVVRIASVSGREKKACQPRPPGRARARVLWLCGCVCVCVCVCVEMYGWRHVSPTVLRRCRQPLRHLARVQAVVPAGYRIAYQDGSGTTILPFDFSDYLMCCVYSPDSPTAAQPRVTELPDSRQHRQKELPAPAANSLPAHTEAVSTSKTPALPAPASAPAPAVPAAAAAPAAVAAPCARRQPPTEGPSSDLRARGPARVTPIDVPSQEDEEGGQVLPDSESRRQRSPSSAPGGGGGGGGEITPGGKHRFVEVVGRLAGACEGGAARVLHDDPSQDFVTIQLLVDDRPCDVPREAVRPGKSPLKTLTKADQRERDQLQQALQASMLPQPSAAEQVDLPKRACAPTVAASKTADTPVPRPAMAGHIAVGVGTGPTGMSIRSERQTPIRAPVLTPRSQGTPDGSPAQPVLGVGGPSAPVALTSGIIPPGSSTGRALAAPVAGPPSAEGPTLQPAEVNTSDGAMQPPRPKPRPTKLAPSSALADIRSLAAVPLGPRLRTVRKLFKKVCARTGPWEIAAEFIELPDGEHALSYAEVVSHPISLTMIKAALKEERYVTFGDLASAIDHLVDNCIRYNTGRDTESMFISLVCQLRARLLEKLVAIAQQTGQEGGATAQTSEQHQTDMAEKAVERGECGHDADAASMGAAGLAEQCGTPAVPTASPARERGWAATDRASVPPTTTQPPPQPKPTIVLGGSPPLPTPTPAPALTLDAALARDVLRPRSS
jgi:hypothetical protein